MMSILPAFWNIFLAAIPFCLILFLEQRFGGSLWIKMKLYEKSLFLFLFFVFILFFPNIPYIFTDSRHILDVCSGNSPHKTCLEAPWAILTFFVYGIIALPFFVLSVQKTSRLLGKIFFLPLQAITPFVFLPLSALGVCLGLFERLNSWNIVNHPLSVIEAGVSYFLELEKFSIWFIFSFLLLGVYFFFRFFISDSLFQKTK
jgi:uncharacterized membrane protein